MKKLLHCHPTYIFHILTTSVVDTLLGVLEVTACSVQFCYKSMKRGFKN